MIGEEIHALALKLFKLNRSITGEGVRKTLIGLKEVLPSIQINEIPSGTQVFDWIIPDEWRVREAYITTPSGTRICDFQENNLHLVGYSTPVRLKLSLEELNRHLHSLPDQPSAIPYVTSYYQKRWGFCLSQNQRDLLEEGTYEVFVDSDLFKGSLTYGECVIEGKSKKEIFISTYICHPSMANNELSGPTVCTFLAKWISSLQNREFTYRFVFIPETIGSIAYLSKHIDWLKANVVAGYNVSCIGDNRAYSYLPSRNGFTLSDVVAKHVLKWIDPNFKSYGWRDRGSDERQYCSPGVDLPIASIMRTKYFEFPEYHTSLDDLVHVVTPAGLEGGYNALRLALEALEKNDCPVATVMCEPQLGKRGLYPTLSTKASRIEVQTIMDLLTWADGKNSLIEIAEKSQVPIWTLYPLVAKLREQGLLAPSRRS